jgi:F0F1-type ATP synthase delta subunit
MSESKKAKKQKIFQLPDQLVGSIDLNRLIRELEKLDDFLYQSQLRKPGTPMKVQQSSRLLEETASSNGYSLLKQTHREHLLKSLRKIEEKAPTIHISFAVEPSAGFSHKLTAWMRKNLHQYLLVEIGLQPTIAVGCSVRTNNQIFDLSLRNRFEEYRNTLFKQMSEPAPKPAEKAEAKNE